jgi:hypothetical protein
MLDIGDFVVHVVSKSARQKWFATYTNSASRTESDAGHEERPDTII